MLQIKLHNFLITLVDARIRAMTNEPTYNNDHIPKSVFDSFTSHPWFELQHIVQLGQSSGMSNTEGLPQSAMKLDLVCPFIERGGTVPCRRLP
mmetsp:Transcript_24377/g.31068  ORF Transcript_24377/g.31068 Transcript_24377/m.31068 type:complete len:93 (+) Transcript_24377:349-627(+)